MRDVFLPTMGVLGPMARTVADMAMLLAVTAGHDARVPLSLHENPRKFTEPLKRDFKGTRIAWSGDFGGRLAVEPGVLELCAESLTAFEALGCRVKTALPDFPMDALWQSFVTLRWWINASNLGPLYDDPAKRALIKPETLWEIEHGHRLSAADITAASATRSAWYHAMREFLSTYDYFLVPSAQVFPFAAETHWPDEIAGRKMDTYHRWMEATVPATFAGLPALNVPVGFGGNGLPMGLQIIGPEAADFACLQLAHAYDEATGWVAKRKPTLLTDLGG
jgi:amidase